MLWCPGRPACVKDRDQNSGIRADGRPPLEQSRAAKGKLRRAGRRRSVENSRLAGTTPRDWKSASRRCSMVGSVAASEADWSKASRGFRQPGTTANRRLTSGRSRCYSAEKLGPDLRVRPFDLVVGTIARRELKCFRLARGSPALFRAGALKHSLYAGSLCRPGPGRPLAGRQLDMFKAAAAVQSRAAIDLIRRSSQDWRMTAGPG